jgi:hypothetical protein
MDAWIASGKPGKLLPMKEGTPNVDVIDEFFGNFTNSSRVSSITGN